MQNLTIISGGQTGIDRRALEIAREQGFPTGGTAAKGYRTELGPDLSLKDFGLKESMYIAYSRRTEENIRDSDGTALYGNPDSRGSELARMVCKILTRPLIINPTDLELVRFIDQWKIKVLNVAGNRASILSPVHRDFMVANFTRTLEMLKTIVKATK